MESNFKIEQESLASQIYSHLVKKKKVTLCLLFLAIVISFFLNIIYGSTFIPFPIVWDALTNNPVSAVHETVVKEIRLPMALMAIVTGMAFAVGGCTMQTVLGNPMASPYTLGISAAAAFGAAAGIILDLNFSGVPDNLLISVNAFICSLGASFLIYYFASRKNSGRHIIILFGIALNFIFNSLTMFLQYIADETKLQSLVFWTFGSLAKSSWDKVFIVTIVTFTVFAILYRQSWQLTALALDEPKALSLGVNVHNVRKKAIVLISLVTSISVCFVGTIGFLGLVAPHLARGLVGEDQRFLLPVSALLGALILLTASLLSKTILPGTLLPIGLITSLMGIPFFIALIFNKGGRAHD